MSDGAETKIKIYRRGGAQRLLILDDGEGLWNLTAFLERRGQPTSLRDLFEGGWFDCERLSRELPGQAEGWESVEAETEDGVPLDADLPILPEEVGKILCLGKNFRAHAEEFGEDVPDEPLVFNKLPETLSPHGAQVHIEPWYTERVDHEAELAAVIGLSGRHICVEDAMEHVAGYTVANDLTARSLQRSDREKGFPWFRGKNMDGFCPLGPAFVPRDYLDISDLTVSAHVNGVLRQEGSTRDWIVDLPHAIAYLSRHIPLHAGDLILTGTPAGVSPLEDGDEVVCSVTGIGKLRTTIRRPPASQPIG